MVRLAVLLVLLLAAGMARADSERWYPFRLVLDLTPSPDAQPVLDPQKLRIDLEREIGHAVEALRPATGVSGDAGVVTITYRTIGGELTVAFAPPAGEALTRTVLPPPGEDVAALAVLLAGNLMRDQAAELLGPPPGPVVAVAPVPASVPPEAELQAQTTEDEDAGPGARFAGLRVEGDVWTGTLSLLNVGLRLSGETAYFLLAASGHRRKGGAWPAVGSRSVGTCRFWAARLRARPRRDVHPRTRLVVSAEAGSEVANGSEPNLNYTNSRLITRVRASLVFRVHPLVALFAGTALAMTTHFYGVIDNDYGPELFAGVRL